jgi:hypothetical protein
MVTTRLHKDMPIPVDVQALLATSDLNDVQDVVIFAGETEHEMGEQLQRFGLVQQTNEE